MIHGGEQARNATRRRARPAQARLTPLLEIQWGTQSKAGKAVQLPQLVLMGGIRCSLLFLDRHVAKVEEELSFFFFSPSLTCGNKAEAGLAHPEIRESY